MGEFGPANVFRFVFGGCNTAPALAGQAASATPGGVPVVACASMSGVEDGWDYEAQPRVVRHRAFVRRLIDKGFRIAHSTATAPEQLRGHLPSGESFYFRERWGEASLVVGDAGTHPLVAATWHGTTNARAEGSGTEADTEAAFWRLLTSYRGSRRG